MNDLSKRHLLAACSTIVTGTAGCLGLDPPSKGSRDTKSPTGDGFEACESVSGDWLTFQGDDRHTGRSSAIESIRSEPTRTTIARDVYDLQTDYAPLVTAERLVTVTQNGVVSMDPTSGDRHWQYTPEKEIKSTPTIGCGAVYVQSRSTKHCLDLATGEVHWTQNLGSANRTGSFVMDQERLFTWPGIRAYGPPTGTRQWRNVVNSGVQGLALDDDSLYATIAANNDGRLEAFDPATGTRQWRCDVVGESYRPPVVAHGHVYMASKRGTVTAVDTETGDPVWQRELSFDLSSMLGVHEDGVVYLPTGIGKTVVALEAATGTTRWETPVDGSALLAPVVGDDLLYVPTGATLAAIDRRTGVKQWEIDAVMNAELAASGDGLYGLRGSDLVRFS